MNKDRSRVVPKEVLSSMSTAALEDLLAHELDAENDAGVNVDLILEITTILDARTGKPNIDVDTAYDDFITNHLGSEMIFDDDLEPPVKPRAHKRKTSRLLAAAAIIVLVLVAASIPAYAGGFNLWEAIAQWTSETFKFDIQSNANRNDREANEQFAEFARILESEGIEASLLPDYLPEGYIFKHIEAKNGEYCAVFESGNEKLSIQIHPTRTGNGTKIEMNDVDPEIYVVNGIEHHIVLNLDLYSVTWVATGYECTIMGLPTIEDAYMIIDSVYWEDSK